MPNTPIAFPRQNQRRPLLTGLSLLMLVLALAPAALAWPFGLGPVEMTGPALYQARCGGCHALDRHRYGPSHQNLYGRTAGTQPGYRYTDALSRSRIVWTAETLDPWIADPRRMVPGTRMDAGDHNPEERRLIIDYLKSNPAPPPR